MATRTYDILVIGPDGRVTRQPVVETVDDSVAAREDLLRAVQDRALSALDVNAAFLALASPTNAQLAAQVKALTRQSTALIRLVLGSLDSTDGT